MKNQVRYVTWLQTTALLTACCLLSPDVWGQVRPERTPVSTRPPAANPANTKAPITHVTLEILTSESSTGVKVHQWSQVLSKLDITLNIRQGLADEKIETTEKKAGNSVRQVRAVGKMDREGRLIFADRTFNSGETDKVAAWVKELKAFGSQGTPAGKPLWGLSKPQFGALHRAFSEPVPFEPQGQPLELAMARFNLPPEYSIQFSQAATRKLAGEREPKVLQPLQGISKGTALAILLSEHGLGLAPNRGATGQIDLVVRTLEETGDVWPVGWPPESGAGPAAAPKLYSYVRIDLEEVSLGDVLELAADKTGIPMLIDEGAFRARDVDLAATKVSHPPKRTTWSLALKALMVPAKAKPELYLDEQGHPFVWVVPLGAKRTGPKAAVERK